MLNHEALSPRAWWFRANATLLQLCRFWLRPLDIFIRSCCILSDAGMCVGRALIGKAQYRQGPAMSHFSSNRLNRSSQRPLALESLALLALEQALAWKIPKPLENRRTITNLSWFSTRFRACLSPKHFRLLLAEARCKCQRLALL